MIPHVERYAMFFWAGFVSVSLLFVFWWSWLHNASIVRRPEKSLLKYVDAFFGLGTASAVIVLAEWMFVVEDGSTILRLVTLAASISWILLAVFSARHVLVVLLGEAKSYKAPPHY